MWRRGWSSHAMFLIERGAVAATTAMYVFYEIWRCEKYSTIKSPQTQSIAQTMATKAHLAMPLRLTIKPSKSLPYIKSILSSYIAAHHTIGTERCNLQKYILLPSSGASHLWTTVRRLSSRHHATQATKPPYPLLNSTGRYHAMPITTFPSAMQTTLARLVLTFKSMVALLPYCRELLAPLSLFSPDRRPGFRVEDSTRACLLKEYLMSLSRSAFAVHCPISVVCHWLKLLNIPLPGSQS
jgi:hypothetical protein